ncbi:ABC transporter permease [Actinomarinicola tropica]|uniref:FtsX-like permease family protein n=1 Tax=Actinomarinicola tropica TaxID=2789776 RepID=A0A5Q2RP44_9ACTN|nr:FtsX-like permease family protein [Actinomarinicola tropica]QGG96361.1 FtsX-like permease family protein [Actinomarinicola tropica]
MLRTTLRSLWEHKRRLISTTVAVFLGVSFMAGTFVLGDTLDESVESLVGEVTVGLDAQVRGPELFDTGFGVLYTPIDQSLVDVVAGVEEVEDAAGYVTVETGVQVLGADGDTIGMPNAAPTIVESFIPNPDISGYDIPEGRGVEAPDEMVINRAAAEDGELELGDTVTLTSSLGRTEYTLVGITTTVSGRDTIAGAILVGLATEQAQELAGLDGQINYVYATAAGGTTQEELVAAIGAELPSEPQLEVITGQQAADELTSTFQEGLSFFSTFLLVFALIALVVGSFIIFNTFSILVAQRGRELALLRAIGATRRQVLVSVLVEAVLIGLVAALIGIVAGIGLATGIYALLNSIGLELPKAGTIVSADTVIWSIVAGVGVTLFSALIPAWRATRVPPIAALRDVATDTSGTSKIRIGIGLALAVLAVVFIAPVYGEDPDTAALQSLGLGAVLLLVALIVLGPVIARPVARAIGAPLSWLRGTTGHLARENASRSPKRTASTAAALMIGIALVGFITILISSARVSIDEQVSRGLKADLIIRAESFGAGIPIAFEEEIAGRDDVATVAALRQGQVQLALPDGDTTTTFMGAINPERYDRAVEVQMVEGSLADLQPGGLVVDRRQAENRDLAVGDTVEVTFLPAANVAELTVTAISDDPQLLGFYTTTHEDWAANVPNQTNGTIFVSAAEGTTVDDLQRELRRAAEEYPGVLVENQDEFLDAIASQLNVILNVVLGLLVVSVLIALIGIANTLSLSVYERTRELGLLRAVGMTRSQLRASVRWEAAIIAVLGTLLGLALAVGLSYSLIQGLGPQGFSAFQVPVGQMAIIVVVGALLGVLASLLPARRAAKLNVLEAIASE